MNAASLRWLAFLVPALVLTGVFVVYPAIDTIRLSFMDWRGYGDARSVGLDNYKELFEDENARGALWHSLLFAAVTAALTVGIGTAMALAIDRKVPGHKAFKFLIFLPVILPTTFIALSWAGAFDGFYGWATELLRAVGIQTALLSNEHTALWTVAFAAILQTTGFPMIVVLAGLGDVPKEIHEAATLEGVSAVERARYISIPHVRDVIATVGLLQLVFMYSNFDFVFVMTKGGPAKASDVVSTFVYDEAFTQQRFGYATAAALVTSLLMAILTMLYLTFARPGGIQRAG